MPFQSEVRYLNTAATNWHYARGRQSHERPLHTISNARVCQCGIKDIVAFSAYTLAALA